MQYMMLDDKYARMPWDEIDTVVFDIGGVLIADAVTQFVNKACAAFYEKYPDLTISLSLYEAVIASGTPENKEHEALAWIRPQDIPLYEFCPADIDIIDRIRREG